MEKNNVFLLLSNYFISFSGSEDANFDCIEFHFSLNSVALKKAKKFERIQYAYNMLQCTNALRTPRA